MRTAFHALLLAMLLATPTFAARTQVYSIRGADCGDCGREILTALKKFSGVKRASWDLYKVEITAVVADGVTDEQVVKAIEAAGDEFHALVGPGQGQYLPQPSYPDGADVAVLTQTGEAVGPLAELRVPRKYTVFDVYADWCGPCRVIDRKLRDLVAKRSDIAVRKLNVVRFDTPLAKEFGGSLSALPRVVVFTADGKRSDFTGADFAPIARALGEKQ